MAASFKVRLLAAIVALVAPPLAQAQEWAGTMSCGPLQNAPNAKSQSPFEGRVTLRLTGRDALLERQWASGTERLEGRPSLDRVVRLEGQGWFYGKEDAAWRTRATLSPAGDGYSGTAVIERRDGQLKYRDCTIALRPEVLPKSGETGTRPVIAASAASARRTADVAAAPRNAAASTRPAGGPIIVTVIPGSDPTGKANPEGPAALAMSPDGTKVAVGTTTGRVMILDARSGSQLSEWPASNRQGAVLALAFSPDGKRFAAGVDRKVVVSDADGSNPRASADFGGRATKLAFSPDGRTVLYASDARETRLCLLDVPNPVMRWCLGAKILVAGPAPKDARVMSSYASIGWLPDNHAIIGITQGTPVALDLISAADGKIEKQLNGNGFYRPGHPFVVTPDGREIVSLANGSRMSRWSLASGELLAGAEKSGREYEVGTVFAQTMQWLPGSKNVILGSVNSQPPTMQIVNAETMANERKSLLRVRLKERDWVTHLQISERADAYAVMIRRPVGQASSGLEISAYELQIWPL